MKPTDISNREYEALLKANEYCNYLGIPLPDIFFHMKEKPEHSRLGKSTLGVCYPEEYRMFVRIIGSRRTEINDTIAHELVHLKFGFGDHNEHFQSYIRALMSKRMFFDGRGLVSRFPNRKPNADEVILTLQKKIKRCESKIRLYTTFKKKLTRKIQRLQKVSNVENRT